MSSLRSQFLSHLAQTSDAPLALEVDKAEGINIWGKDGKKYIDLISGIAVSNLGHNYPAINEAIKNQLDKHSHLMVYGEFIQEVQVQFAKLLTEQLPKSLDSVYFVNSGSEAIEGAMKLAKRATGRSEIIAFKKAYHGSTQGALSVIGDESFRRNFRPLLPDIRHIHFNDEKELEQVTTRTACVIVEPIQSEVGVVLPQNDFLKKLQNRCKQTETLLVVDEAQTGFGRTGTMFAFEQYNIIPDILVLAKALGGGMPLGAFIASKEIMKVLTKNPVLGHITTFGGHPLSCAAGLAHLKVLVEQAEIIKKVQEKGKLFTGLLKHEKIVGIRFKGLLMAIEFENAETNQKIIQICLQEGILTDWFLFADNCMRIAPPLIITEEEIKVIGEIILKQLEAL